MQQKQTTQTRINTIKAKLRRKQNFHVETLRHYLCIGSYGLAENQIEHLSILLTTYQTEQ